MLCARSADVNPVDTIDNVLGTLYYCENTSTITGPLKGPKKSWVTLRTDELEFIIGNIFCKEQIEHIFNPVSHWDNASMCQTMGTVTRRFTYVYQMGYQNEDIST